MRFIYSSGIVLHLLGLFFLSPLIMMAQEFVTLDTAKINIQINSINSLVRAREFSAAQKVAFGLLKSSDKINYLPGKAWGQFYLGVTEFELNQVDSAMYWLRRAKSDFISTKNYNGLISTYNKIGYYFRRTDQNDSSIFYYSLAIERANSINDSTSLAEAKYGLGMVYTQIGRYNEALDLYYSSLSIRERINDKSGIAAVLNSMGILFWEQGAFSTALDFFYKALSIRVEVSDKLGESYQHNNIGLIYRDIGDYKKALEHLKTSWDIKIQLNDKRGISNSLMNIGSVYLLQDKIDSALTYFEDALNLKLVLLDRGGVANVYRFMGETYYKIKLYEKAKDFLGRALADYTKLDEPRGISESKLKLAMVLFETGNRDGAVKLINEVLDTARNHKMNDLIAESHKTLYQFSLSSNDCQSALKHYRYYVEVKDSLAGAKTMKQIISILLKAEYDKIVRENYDRFESKLREIESKRKLRIRLSLLLVFVGTALVGLTAGLLYSLFKRRQALQEVENQRISVAIQRKELEDQRDEIERQKNLVVYQRDRIINILTDLGESIEYARKIQQAVFPSDLQMGQFFRDFFVLYLPKETVGGDFYWVGNCAGRVGFAVADCTGHGVPGGFMSMLGISMINDMIANTQKTSPAAILGALRENVITALRQGGHEDDSHDGMDIVFCTFERSSGIFTYAGANMPIIIRTNANIQPSERIVNIGPNLIEIKPDRMPIAFFDKMEKFSEISVKLNQGDVVYLFTDGFADQFGGLNNKKFGYQQFRMMINDIKNFPLSEQKNIIFQTLEKWKGEAENQTDDILIMAVQL